MKLILHHNRAKKGIELTFDSALKEEDAAILATLGFKQKKGADQWYGYHQPISFNI